MYNIYMQHIKQQFMTADIASQFCKYCYKLFHGYNKFPRLDSSLTQNACKTSSFW